MKTKFSKGIWNITTLYDKLCSDIKCDGKRICQIKHYASLENDPPYEEGLANAKLIAAAPDLLEALLNIENDTNTIPDAIWNMRNNAIKKAIE